MNPRIIVSVTVQAGDKPFKVASDTIYYYVVSLVNHYGQLEASYSYDAWGKLLSIVDSDNNEITDANNVANLNIFRYRGYCYDTETGLYYLQSRYYDPNTGRFVNADDITGSNRDIVSYNLFAYCSNFYPYGTNGGRV